MEPNNERTIVYGKFNRSVFVDNLKWIIDKKSLKASDIEKKAGISLGSISRIVKPGSTAAISKEFLLAISYALRIPLEDLVYNDYCNGTKVDMEICEFFATALENTKNGKLQWGVEKDQELRSAKQYMRGDTSHPLMKGTYPIGILADYKSLYAEYNNVCLQGYIYNAPLDENLFMYMAKALYLNDDTEHIEVYLVRRISFEEKYPSIKLKYPDDPHDCFDVKTFVCSGDETIDTLNHLLNSLYTILERAASTTYAPQEVNEYVKKMYTQYSDLTKGDVLHR